MPVFLLRVWVVAVAARATVARDNPVRSATAILVAMALVRFAVGTAVGVIRIKRMDKNPAVAVVVELMEFKVETVVTALRGGFSSTTDQPKDFHFMKLFLLLMLVLSTAFAQSSGCFAITRSVVAAGGTTFSSSARFQLGSTIAQPLAAVPSSARFSIQGGYWIQPAPIIFAPAKTGNDFIFSFQTEPGKTYTAQYTDTLAPPNWQNLPSVAGNGAVASVTNSAPGIPKRYFRLIEQ